MSAMLHPELGVDDGAQPELAPSRRWLEASDGYGSASVLKNLLPLLALYAAIPYVADRSVALALCSAPLVGLLLYRLTMVMHDCGHATLFKARSANERVGKLLGFVTGIDFGRFKEQHWEHHKRYGLPGDPQGFHYLGLQSMTAARFVAHALKPLLGLNLRHVFAKAFYIRATCGRRPAVGSSCSPSYSSHWRC